MWVNIGAPAFLFVISRFSLPRRMIDPVLNLQDLCSFQGPRNVKVVNEPGSHVIFRIEIRKEMHSIVALRLQIVVQWPIEMLHTKVCPQTIDSIFSFAWDFCYTDADYDSKRFLIHYEEGILQR